MVILSSPNIDVTATFNQIQDLLRQFIADKVSYSRYLGEGLSTDDRLQMFFKIVSPSRSRQSASRVMTLAVSGDLMHSYKVLDSRPIRAVITVFFQSKRSMRRVAKLY